MNNIKALSEKHREIIVYIIFGILTTAVNLSAFYLLELTLNVSYLINNAIAWVIGVIFAFVTNKIFVFKSKSTDVKVVGKEALEFLGARVFSFGVEELGMWLLVDVAAFGTFSKTIFGFIITGEIISKVILAVIVVILNYIFSKFIIFKK